MWFPAPWEEKSLSRSQARFLEHRSPVHIVEWVGGWMMGGWKEAQAEAVGEAFLVDGFLWDKHQADTVRKAKSRQRA